MAIPQNRDCDPTHSQGSGYQLGGQELFNSYELFLDMWLYDSSWFDQIFGDAMLSWSVGQIEANAWSS